MRSHILGKKNAKRRRRLDAPKLLADSDRAKVKARHAMRSHILGKKNSKRRRRLDEPKMLSAPDQARAKALLRK